MKRETAEPRGRVNELRLRAKARLSPGRDTTRAKPIDAQDPRTLLHELQVHQAELEIQNEELIRARGETEAALALYTELFSFAPVGYATLAGDGTIVEVNHLGARILGVERRRAVGLRMARQVVPEARKDFAAMLSRARAIDDRLAMDAPIRTADGRDIVVRMTLRAISSGLPVFLLAFEDVTQARAQEARLKEAEAKLREADARKDEFLAVLSHELRNPLTPIRTSLYVMAHTAPGSPEASKAHAVIDRQVKQMTRLVDDLLDMTRIMKNAIPLRRETLDVGVVFMRAVEDHRSTFASGGIRLEWEADPGAYWVDGDPVRLVQVLGNLLGNARKFTPPSGTVKVTLRRAASRCLVEVRDSGIGIPPELLTTLFEPFSQSPQPLARSRGGLGLGLAMVKGFVTLHGGSVRIASDGVDHGAVVTMELPLTRAPVAAARVETPRPMSAVRPGSVRKVLIIDDNVDTADMLCEALGRDNDVRVAYDGFSGLEIARDFVPAVVICDIGLPGMDGYEVARAIRADASLCGAHLVALSGYARLEDRRQSVVAGFNDHVAKPPEIPALERILEGIHASSRPPAGASP